MGKTITLTFNDYPSANVRKWQIVKSNYGEYAIVTNIEIKATCNTVVTYQVISLSKYGVIRKLQIWMLNKIFKQNK